MPGQQSDFARDDSQPGSATAARPGRRGGTSEPGKEFGMEGHLRLSYAGSIKDITDGIARMKWALDPSSPNEIYIGDRKLVRDWL